MKEVPSLHQPDPIIVPSQSSKVFIHSLQVCIRGKHKVRFQNVANEVRRCGLRTLYLTVFKITGMGHGVQIMRGLFPHFLVTLALITLFGLQAIVLLEKRFEFLKGLLSHAFTESLQPPCMKPRKKILNVSWSFCIYFISS